MLVAVVSVAAEAVAISWTSDGSAGAACVVVAVAASVVVAAFDSSPPQAIRLKERIRMRNGISARFVFS